METVYNIARGKPVTEKFISLVGDIENPITVKVPVGTPIKDLINLVEINSPNFKIIAGGLMMGKLVNDLNEPVTKTLAGLIFLPDAHPLVRYYSKQWKDIRKIGKSACDQCTFCTELCPRYLLGHPIEPHKSMRALGFQYQDPIYLAHNLFCCECGLCSLYSCPENLDPRNVCIYFKNQVRKAGIKWKEKKELKVHPLREYRLTPLKKLITKLGIKKYDKPAPFKDITINPEKVIIKLNQHIGTPCKPIVRLNERVTKGQLIAHSLNEKFGSAVHSSIDGVVSEINENFILIKRI